MINQSENTYKDFSIKDIEDILSECLAEREKQPVREWKILASCRTNGMTNLEFENICNDPECKICSEFHKTIEEEFKNGRNK